MPTENSWSDDCIEKLKEYQNLSIETTVKAKENLYGVQLVVKLSADLDEDISIDLAQSLCLDGLALSIDVSIFFYEKRTFAKLMVMCYIKHVKL